MKPFIYIPLFFLSCFTLFSQIDTDRYLWQYPLQEELKLNDELVAELRSHFDDIINSGDLFFRPLPCRYHDQVFEHYFLYKEPGRILQTIADAFPYLRVDQQNALKPMVVQLFNHPVHRPWAMELLPIAAGKNREPYESDVLWGEENDFQRFRPTIQNIYAVWSYLYRTGDTVAVSPYYENIRNFYQQKVVSGSDRGNMYGTLSAHIGMARLAYIFGDSVTIQSVRIRFGNFLQNATDIENIDHIAAFGTAGWDAPYGEEYTSRKDQFIYRGYIFLNMSPEIGRFIQDHVLEAVKERHQFGLDRFPLWWLRQAPYFSRWTGDEGIGFPSESFGMYMPVERWVQNADASRLAGFMKSAAVGIADSYWLESLVKAIEAAGTDYWVDVRSSPFELDLVMGLPQVETTPISNITQTTASSGGRVIQSGGSPVLERGIIWNTSGQPDLDNALGVTLDGNGVGNFTSLLENLESNTQYFVRAYASNESGLAYGNTLIFNTLPNVFTITASHGAGGIIEPSGIIEVIEQDSIVFVIIADDNYEIDEVLVDGIDVGPVHQYIFDSIANHHEIIANFRLMTDVIIPFNASVMVSLFPNPAHSKILIKISDSENELQKEYTLYVSDIKGKIIQQHKLNTGNSVIDLSGFPAGLYLFRITDGFNWLEKQVFIVR